MRILHRVLGALVLVAAVVAIPAPASAGGSVTTWQTGVKVSSPVGRETWIIGSPDAWAWSNLTRCGDWESRAWVRRTGDYVYLKDECADGRSAVAQVTFPYNGTNYHRMCRNSHGNGTWARCNFNWPEGPMKQLTAGSNNQSTGYKHWDYGAGVYFSDSGFSA